MRLTIVTGKELRYNLLTFTIFIIQSQIGAIPVMAAILEFQNLRKAGEMDKVLPRGWW